ncbi:MAG: aspartate aminotransferase family protein [Endomicrobiia bacterium]|nr:aspartate aminotransferase family protein [Endomicrobiia bacterium]
MNIARKEKKYLVNVYKKVPLTVYRAVGKYVFGDNGRRHLDFFSGLSVSNFGHAHPKIVSAIKSQAAKYLHVSNLYHTAPQAALSERLSNMAFPGKVFFSNSGAEANECAIKLARKWGSPSGKYEIITFRNSFHGRTIATIAATAQTKFQKGFGPLPIGFKYALFNDISSVKKLVSRKTAAIMVEPVQGEGGVIPSTEKFLKGLAQICRGKKILLIFDEIQTGMGRCGAAFAFQTYGVRPDILTLAKALGGGLPLGATLVSEKLAGVLAPGDHGSTFGGNPVSCAASLAVMELLDTKTLSHARSVGKYFFLRLEVLKKKHPSLIKEVRGLGLMVGAELFRPGGDIVAECLKRGLLINCTQDKVLRFLPPLIVERRDIDEAVSILDEVLTLSQWTSTKI